MLGKRGAWVATSLTIIVVLSGCTLPGQTGKTTLKVEFATNWSSTSYHYFMTASEPLPSNFKVVVTEKETGIRQEFQASQLAQRLPGKYDVQSSITLKDGKTYRVEGYVGGTSVGSRELRALESSLEEPSDLTLRASYSFSMSNVDATPDDQSDFHVRGTLATDANPSRTLLKFSGTGTTNASSEGYSQKITITTFDTEDTDGNTTKALVVGQGPWTLSGDPSGSGQATVRTEFLGREMKADKTGKLYLCEKTSIKTDITGNLVSEGETIQYVNHTTETEWSRVDTEQVIWHAVSWSATYTYQGKTTPDNGNLDEAITEEAAEPDLLDIVDFSGFEPAPFVAGDNFLENGKEGVTIQYVVADGGTRQAAGQSFSSLKVTGTLASGATGTETWYVVGEGALAGLPLSWTGHYQKGVETADFRADLLTLA